MLARVASGDPSPRSAAARALPSDGQFDRAVRRLMTPLTKVSTPTMRLPEAVSGFWRIRSMRAVKAAVRSGLAGRQGQVAVASHQAKKECSAPSNPAAWARVIWSRVRLGSMGPSSTKARTCCG